MERQLLFGCDLFTKTNVANEKQSLDLLNQINDAKEKNNSGATFEDERPDPKTHRAERLRLNRGKLSKTHTLPMDNLYTTMSHF